jgi:hypothetical protein
VSESNSRRIKSKSRFGVYSSVFEISVWMFELKKNALLTLPLHESFSSESSSLTQSLTISSEEKEREGRESVTSMVAIKPHYENVESANIHPQEQFVDVSLEAQNTQLPYINNIVMISIILNIFLSVSPYG